jgi:DMSO/TMAO reductase YedYZ heme-binding membrane subunit
MVLRNELAFFGAVAFLALAVSIVALSVEVGDPLVLALRLLALNGFIALSVAAIMTPFLKEITIFLRKPFMRVHHYFAATGLILVTLHPILVAILTLNPAILLPNLGSVELFFVYGGSVALIAIYVAFGAVLLRRKMIAHWRYFHMLMYLALFFAVVHGNLLGLDFAQNLALRVLYIGLFAAAIFAFVLQRLRFYRIRKAHEKNSAKR